MKFRQTIHWLVAALLLCSLSLPAVAQGGPPLITNDPDTPGAGKWEINIAVAGAHGEDFWDLAAPDLDINYGLGERMQLSVHGSWNHQRVDDGLWQSGSGPVELAVRWRFIDEEKSGFSMAVQPHWAKSWSAAAIRRGLVSPNEELGIPLQLSKHFGKANVGLEVGRNFIEREADEWQAGLFWSRDCAKDFQCLAEINTVKAADSSAETVLNFGARKTINENLVLLGSLGRQLSNPDGPKQVVFYVGIQLLR
jgi:hypothetical protein